MILTIYLAGICVVKDIQMFDFEAAHLYLCQKENSLIFFNLRPDTIFLLTF